MDRDSCIPHSRAMNENYMGVNVTELQQKPARDEHSMQFVTVVY